ncbi:capsular exopolysaccharide family protein [Thermomicrobium sp. CFH 73360]|uniref:polysaccharide biosynthesis tyrosine autokinase n=1 Tax=Thermomicrobium sp. CFH 73360 TaxID=2951987 RepID=UPI0020773D47|nr:capsular exopolysaccharide family protein [Thermomicrobium sp. CFH 73360]MCM8747349.1 capsular exopolysaccharide family protein [Thermomicrobium sp. CFH 73360]
MRPEEYLAIVLRRWWIVLLAGVAAALVAYGYSRTQPPTYQVSVRLMAVAQPPDYWLDLYAKNRLASYQDLIRTSDFVARALRQAGLNDDPGQVLGSLALARNQDSNVVQLVVTDTDPERAARVANALADAFVAQSIAENQRILEQFRDPLGQRIQGTVAVVKLDTPSPPSTPIGPRTRLNTAAGLVLGLVFGVLVTFGIEYFEDVLRTARETSRALGLPVVAEVPGFRNRRSSRVEENMADLIVVEAPLSPAAEAYRTLRAVLRRSNESLPPRTILVCGVGRSSADSASVAANLAAASAVAGERVLLVDADLRHPSLQTLARETVSIGLAEWLGNSDQRPAPVYGTSLPTLSLLPAGHLPAATNPADLLSRSLTGERLTLLQELGDRVIFHTAPLPSYGEALALAGLVEGVLLVIRSGVTPRTAAQQAKEQLERAGAPLLGVVLLRG